jgi:hypothetical protein
MYFARLGVFPGVADLVLVLPDKSVAFLEIKQLGGKLSPAQQSFQAKCALLGLKYRIAYSISDAEEVLRNWGALRGAREPDAWEHISEPLARVVDEMAQPQKRVA